MKQFKRLFSLMLVAVMLIPMIAATGVSVSSATLYYGTCGDDLSWTLDIETGVLNITGTGDMDDYSYEDVHSYGYRTTAPWKYEASQITSVVIDDSVVSIGEYAFAYCGTIESVIIGDSVINIGKKAFYKCTSLESAIMGDSLEIIDTQAFQYCGLTSLVIPDSVINLGIGAFGECSALKSVVLGTSVSVISRGAFDFCTSLESIHIPASVTNIVEDAFLSCNSIKSYTVDKNNQYFSSDEYGVLYNKDKTVLLQYPIGNSRTHFDIPSTVKSIGYRAFFWATSLTDVKIPHSVKEIGKEGFW